MRRKYNFKNQKRFYKKKALGLPSKEKLYGMSLKKVTIIMMQIEFMRISKLRKLVFQELLSIALLMSYLKINL